MLPHIRNCLIAGLSLAAACASARKPSGDVESAQSPEAAYQLLFDTTVHARLFRQLDSAMADTVWQTRLQQAMADTALRAGFERAMADSALLARLERSYADTAVWAQLERTMHDTLLHAHLRQLSAEADSILARLQRSGVTRRP